jgi:hypothetical protein
LRIDLIAFFLRDGLCGAFMRLQGADSTPGKPAATAHAPRVL